MASHGPHCIRYQSCIKESWPTGSQWLSDGEDQGRRCVRRKNHAAIPIMAVQLGSCKQRFPSRHSGSNEKPPLPKQSLRSKFSPNLRG